MVNLETNSSSQKYTRKSYFTLAVFIAVIGGFLLRAFPVFSVGFPLNDGGLFYQMSLELKISGYRLPLYTGYNLSSIPFAYPPLGLYIAAGLSEILSISLLSIFHYLPLIASLLTLLAVFFLVKEFLTKETAIVTAFVIFALSHKSFTWQIMGGGITRSFGYLFSVLSLIFFVRSLGRESPRLLVIAAIFGAMAISSHLGTATFVAVSVFALSLSRPFFCTARYMAGYLFLAALLSAPWWGTVIQRHGTEVFIAAAGTAGSIFVNGYHPHEVLTQIGYELYKTYSQYYLPIYGFLLALGTLHAIAEKKLWLVLWFVLVPIVDRRQGYQYAIVPLSILCANAVSEVIIPYFYERGRERAARVFLVVAAFLYLSSELAYILSDPRSEYKAMGPELEALEWIKKNTEPSAVFAVVEENGWWQAKVSEWMPAITRRAVLNTVQGTEWLPGGTYQRNLRRSDDLRSCARSNSSCIDAWERKHRVNAEFVFITGPVVRFARNLEFSLDQDGRYSRVFSSQQAGIIFKKN